MAQRDMEVYLHSFSNSVLGGGVWSSHSGCFTSTERTMVWMFEDEVSSEWDSNSGPPARSVVTISTMLPWLPAVTSLDSKY